MSNDSVHPSLPPLPGRVILDLRMACNLRCPMCPVHGEDGESHDKAPLEGEMPREAVLDLLDELQPAGSLIHPQLYGEPLLAHNFADHVREIKARGLPMALNTNGLTLTEETARLLVETGVEAVMVSVDALTPETLRKVRGIDRLDKIEAAVRRLLAARGEAKVPRIGVSFTVQDLNRHEVEPFVEKWIEEVDCVRLGTIAVAGVLQGVEVPEHRVPCPALYMTMPVHNDGSVSICCLDGFRETNMGNVFERGVAGVWLGPEFMEVRRLHETGQYDSIPLCANCNRWVSYQYQEEVQGNLLIRRSPEYTYYNRIDRLDTWQEQARGGHATSESPA